MDMLTFAREIGYVNKRHQCGVIGLELAIFG